MDDSFRIVVTPVEGKLEQTFSFGSLQKLAIQNQINSSAFSHNEGPQKKNSDETESKEQENHQIAAQPSFNLTSTSSASPSSSNTSSVSQSKKRHSTGGFASPLDPSDADALPLNLDSVILFVDVLEGKQLAAKDLSGTSDPFLVMNVQGQVQKTPVVWKTLNPVWENAVYQFELSSIEGYFKFEAFDKDRIFKDEFLGFGQIDLSLLKNEKIQTFWIRLSQGTHKKSKVSGEIKFLFHLSHSEVGKSVCLSQRIMFNHYDILLNHFATRMNVFRYVHHFDAVFALPKETTVRAILFIAMKSNFLLEKEKGEWDSRQSSSAKRAVNARNLIEFIIENEVTHSDSDTTVFRANNFNAKVIAAYIKLIGEKYLGFYVNPLIEKISNDPEILNDGNAIEMSEIASRCRETIIKAVERLLDSLIQSRNTFPRELVHLCVALRKELLKRFGATKDQKILISSAIGGIIFLRFIVPSISVHKNTSDNVHKALTIVSKIILNLSNGTEPKDEATLVFLPFLKANFKKVEDFLGSFADENFAEEENPIVTTEEEIDERLLYSLFNVHNYLYDNLSELRKRLEEKKPAFSCRLAQEDSLEGLAKILKQTFDIVHKIGPPPSIPQRPAPIPDKKRNNKEKLLNEAVKAFRDLQDELQNSEIDFSSPREPSSLFYLSLVRTALIVANLLLFIFFFYTITEHRRQSKEKEKLMNKTKSLTPASSSKNAARNVCLITAHPDDECMFFTPTLLALLDQSEGSIPSNVFVLCLSTGNYDGLGSIRSKELVDCCMLYGIPRERVFVLDEFQDGPRNKWDAEKVSQIIRRYVQQLDVDVILTFDKKGISGHPNHVDVHFGVKHFLSEWNQSGEQKQILGLELESTNILRKYIGFVDIPMSIFTQQRQSQASDSFLFTVPFRPWKDFLWYRMSLNAMKAHKTQLVWFRYLFIAFSRYSFVNTLRKIEEETKTKKG